MQSKAYRAIEKIHKIINQIMKSIRNYVKRHKISINIKSYENMQPVIISIKIYAIHPKIM